MDVIAHSLLNLDDLSECWHADLPSHTWWCHGNTWKNYGKTLKKSNSGSSLQQEEANKTTILFVCVQLLAYLSIHKISYMTFI